MAGLSKYKDKIKRGSEIQEIGSYIPYGIPTESLCVDLAIGCPGIPGGRLTQVYGLDGCGKSTLMQHLLASCQKMGGTSVLVDTEDGYDLERAERIGVDLEKLIVLEPDCLEELLDMLVQFTKEFFASPENTPGKTPLLFVVDSMEGLVTRSMKESSADDKYVGAVARVLGANLPSVLKIVCRDYKATLVVVSQQYDRVGAATFFGPSYEVKGGRALKYRASLRMEIKARQGKTGLIEDSDGRVVGYKNLVKIWKNKSAPPFKEADYILTFDSGIDRYLDLLEAAMVMDILDVRGGGSYRGKIGKREVEFRGRARWPEVCDSLGGPDKVYRWMTRKAIKLGYMKRYEVSHEES